MNDWPCHETKAYHDARCVDQYPERVRADRVEGFFHDARDGAVGSQFGGGERHHDEAQEKKNRTAQRAAIEAVGGDRDDEEGPGDRLGPTENHAELFEDEKSCEGRAEHAEFGEHLAVGGAGGANYVAANQATTAGTVTTAAQPNITSTGTLTTLIVTGSVKTSSTTFSGLGSASTAGAGARSFVTDANLVVTGNFGATISGSGANSVPVYSDGTNWKIG